MDSFLFWPSNIFVGPRILYTSAWSLFFLIASIVPLIFPDKTPINDQLLAIILFSISWSLTLIPFLWFSNANNEKFTLFPLDYISFCLGIIFFILHIIIDTKLGWIGFFFFFTAWFRTIRNIGDSLKFFQMVITYFFIFHTSRNNQSRMGNFH